MRPLMDRTASGNLIGQQTFTQTTLPALLPMFEAAITDSAHSRQLELAGRAARCGVYKCQFLTLAVADRRRSDFYGLGKRII